jgi:hypothetical protein
MKPLPESVRTDCQRCRRRPKASGGSGSCPFSASVRRAYRGGSEKGASDCPHFVEGDYVRPKVALQARLHPQEAALF